MNQASANRLKPSVEEAFVKACYQVLLRRSPELEGLEEHVRLLDDGMDMKTMLEGFVRCSEFSNGLRHFIAKYQSNFDCLLLDNTQSGELQHILKWLTDNGSHHQLILDVGANSRNGSNSFDLLAHFKWRGLLIEANPNLIPGLQRDFGRLDVEILHTAVGTDTGEADLFLGVNDAISSLAERNVASWGPVSGGPRAHPDAARNPSAAFDAG